MLSQGFARSHRDTGLLDMADPLTSPLDVIDELFRQHAASSNPPGAQWGERQHLVKALGLEDEQAFARIPCLNDQVSADTVRPFSLVRYRALVQDLPGLGVWRRAASRGGENSRCPFPRLARDCG